MAFKKLKNRRAETEIPTSSMADIAFLLIIFFMLTAVFTSSSGIPNEFPEDDPTQLDVQPEESIHIRILGDGQYVVDRSPMNFDEMAGYVNDRIQRSPEKPVIIDPEASVPYFTMIDVFDLLKQLEVKNVALPTKTEKDRWKAFFQ